MAYQQTRSILKQQGLAPKKKLGQNFLVHRHTAQRIVDLAELAKDDSVIEVGVGLGALTRPLAKTAGKVIGLETDSGIIRMHQQQGDLPENVTLIHEDVLKINFSELLRYSEHKLKLVANLPYSISSPFLFRLIDHCDIIDSAVVMVQKEVALRLLAEPGTKEYGVPTVMLASCADVKPLLEVKPAEFHPRPKVDSMVIRISFNPLPARVKALGNFDRKLLKNVVNGAFGQRRKTLLNALSATGLIPDKQILRECIAGAGIAPTIRAEKLFLEDFITLTNSIQHCLDSTVQ
ncbi:MAG: ribosomal RNA small subunit methyltransferase A [Desulfobulbaceae bacterium]|nr:ribosomal RNA small subunit methyltransferase A [Desulfobulbaceae bacterium]